MSIPVALDRLRDEIARFGTAPFLLTVAPEGGPHAVAAAAEWDGDELVAPLGRRSAANLASRTDVTLLWAGAEGEHSLIVDATAVLADGADGPVARLAPRKAVLHRPGPAPEGRAGSACGSDCVPLAES